VVRYVSPVGDAKDFPEHLNLPRFFAAKLSTFEKWNFDPDRT
jgi:hypothetical protein